MECAIYFIEAEISGYLVVSNIYTLYSARQDSPHRVYSDGAG